MKTIVFEYFSNNFNINFRFRIALFLLLISGGFNAFSQQKYRYLVLLKDKIGTPFSINQPLDFLSQRAIDRRFKQGIRINESDLPPNPAYLTSITQTGATVVYKSRWMNAALVEATETQKNAILNLSFVRGIEFNRPLKQIRTKNTFDKFAIENTQTLNYGDANAQILMLGADKMHQRGFRGEGMLIAVLDDGFLNVNTSVCLQHLITNNRILQVYDFVDNDQTVYTQGGHGTSVLSTIAGYVPSQMIAPAFEAQFALFRTEDVVTETRVEEAYWLFAAERADSLGADVINTSLGYSLFDNPADNYTTAQMDGKTALCTRAADLAAERGMAVVISAGNSGNSSWGIITAPADADSVLAVGAVSRTGSYASFSSRGNTADGRIKPDVVAVGSGTALCGTSGFPSTSSGTSFSAPLISGLVAGFWQANPHLTANEVLTCIRKSGHQFTAPTTQLGYGKGNFERADSVAKAEFAISPIAADNNMVSVTVLPSNKSDVVLKFSNSLMNNQLRTTFINLNTKQIIFQDSFILNSANITKTISTNEIEPNTILRIEDLTQKKTLKIMRW
ncbi:MAG: S8 family serine peptidase [Spirosomataceae bacterium]